MSNLKRTSPRFASIEIKKQTSDLILIKSETGPSTRAFTRRVTRLNEETVRLLAVKQSSTHRFGELVFANCVSMVTARRADGLRSGALGQENIFPN